MSNARIIIIISLLEIFKLTKCAYIYSFKRPTLPRCNTKRRTRCSIRIVIRVLDRFNSYEISALQKDGMKGSPANTRGLACFVTCLKLKPDVKINDRIPRYCGHLCYCGSFCKNMFTMDATRILTKTIKPVY